MKTRTPLMQTHGTTRYAPTLTLCGLLLAIPVAGAAEPAKGSVPATANAPAANPAAGKPASVRLTQIRGRVMINVDGSYQAARPNQTIPAGAKIITGEDAVITMIFSDGCTRELKANSMFTVPSMSECAGAAPVERVYVAAPPSSGAPAPGPQTMTTTTNTGGAPKAGTSFMTYVAGAAGATLVGAALNNQDDDRKNISDE